VLILQHSFYEIVFGLCPIVASPCCGAGADGLCRARKADPVRENPQRQVELFCEILWFDAFLFFIRFFIL
jgi:hypothetical protein